MNIKNEEVKKINKRLRKSIRGLKDWLNDCDNLTSITDQLIDHHHVNMAYLLIVHDTVESLIRLKTRSFKGKAIGITYNSRKVKRKFKTKIVKSYGQVQNIRM